MVSHYLLEARGEAASIIYVDILTGKKLSLIKVANMDITYWSIRSSMRVGWRWGKESVIILASCEHHFSRERKNLVQHRSNNISIILKRPYITYYYIHNKTGLAKLTDRHGVGNHAPLVDRSQDVVLEWGRQNDTHTVIQFTR